MPLNDPRAEAALDALKPFLSEPGVLNDLLWALANANNKAEGRGRNLAYAVINEVPKLVDFVDKLQKDEAEAAEWALERSYLLKHVVKTAEEFVGPFGTEQIRDRHRDMPLR
jgi:hypothetical protein